MKPTWIQFQREPGRYEKNERPTQKKIVVRFLETPKYEHVSSVH